MWEMFHLGSAEPYGDKKDMIDVKRLVMIKVICPKYFKHSPYTVAYTIDCVCSKMLNQCLNRGFFFHFSSLYPAIETSIYFAFKVFFVHTSMLISH